MAITRLQLATFNTLQVMGCYNSKTDPNTRKGLFTLCWRKRNKVVAINVPLQEKVGTSMDSGTSNATRKTEQTVLMQLKGGGGSCRRRERGAWLSYWRLGACLMIRPPRHSLVPRSTIRNTPNTLHTRLRRAEPDNIALHVGSLQSTKQPLIRNRSEQD
ncbi:uncharacterized protein LOC117323242 [Pecten maximus]|uniref:uncharacterized protein LOC117323242 n=1 Tax=Pecten maximus TaxID=6579 RepID=UPI0014587EF5|nr:uncharacterized protein LOC117323242 [Pecten maximus]